MQSACDSYANLMEQTRNVSELSAVSAQATSASESQDRDAKADFVHAMKDYDGYEGFSPQTAV